MSRDGELGNGAAGGFYEGVSIGLVATTSDDPVLGSASSMVKADPAIHSAKLMYFLSDQHGSATVSYTFGRPNKPKLSQSNTQHLYDMVVAATTTIVQ